MMKGIILPLIGVVCVAIPTIFGIIPPVLGVLAMLVMVLLKDVLITVLARGLPWAIITQRIRGGLLWGVWDKTNNIKIDRFDPVAGTIVTKKHGSFNIMPSRLFKVDGVPIGIAPEGVGYNVGLDHVLLINELKRRGITDIRDVADVNEFGQIQGWKDSPHIKDLRKKFNLNVGEGMSLDLSGFNDFYKYCAEAANPYHQDARVKIGIAQGIIKPEGGRYNWLVYVGVMVLLVGIGVGVLLMLRGGEEQIIRIITDNAIPTVIPA